MGTNEQPSKKLLGDMLLEMHSAGAHALKADVSEAGDVVDDIEGAKFLRDGALKFESIAQRNALVAKTCIARLGSAFSFEEAVEVVRRLRRHDLQSSDKAAGRLIALLVQDRARFQELRVFASESPENRHFVATHLPEGIEHLDKLPMEMLIALHGDLEGADPSRRLGHLLAIALDKRLKLSPAEARAMYEACISSSEPFAEGLIAPAIAGIAAADPTEAIRCVHSEFDAGGQRAIAATWTASRLLLEAENRETAELIGLAARLNEFILTPELPLAAAAARAAARCLHLLRTFDANLQRAGQSGNLQALEGITIALFAEPQEMRAAGGVPGWLKLMVELPSASGHLGTLDCYLSTLVVDPASFELVVELLSARVERYMEVGGPDKQIATGFAETFTAIFAHPALASVLITRWLLEEDTRYAGALRGALSEARQHLDSPAFAMDLVDSLSAKELLFLVRRMLGFVFIREQATSLAFSLLEARDARTRTYDLVEQVLVSEIGYDYPKSMVRACETKREQVLDDSSKVGLLDKVVAKIRLAGKHLDELPQRKELSPSSALSHKFAAGRAKEMANTQKAARAQSVIASLFAEIQVKGGTSTISFDHGEYGQEHHMATFSHSIELPRRVVFDPVGYEIHLASLRTASKD